MVVAGREGRGTVEADQRAQLFVVARAGLGRRKLGAQPLDLVLEVFVLGLGIEGVADPAGQVTRGLQRAAGPFLERGHRLQEASLDRMEAA